MKHNLALVKQCIPVAEGIFEMILYSSAWLEEVMLPGQFVHIRRPSRKDLLLRRPISIMDFDPETAELKLIIQVAGEGTKDITAALPGDEMDVIAPIGRGFSLAEAIDAKLDSAKPLVYICGGGVGIAPLIYAAKEFSHDCDIEAFLGYRSSAHVYCADKMAELCRATMVCTDDGSTGLPGYAPEPLIARIGEKKPDLILACGPAPMLKAVRRIALENGIACQLSLEERMGCGVGACLVCNCKVVNRGVADGSYEYRRVCVDGPVFPAEEVIFDE